MRACSKGKASALPTPLAALSGKFSLSPRTSLPRKKKSASYTTYLALVPTQHHAQAGMSVKPKGLQLPASRNTLPPPKMLLGRTSRPCCSMHVSTLTIFAKMTLPSCHLSKMTSRGASKKLYSSRLSTPLSIMTKAVISSHPTSTLSCAPSFPLLLLLLLTMPTWSPSSTQPLAAKADRGNNPHLNRPHPHLNPWSSLSSSPSNFISQ